MAPWGEKHKMDVNLLYMGYLIVVGGHNSQLVLEIVLLPSASPPPRDVLQKIHRRVGPVFCMHLYNLPLMGVHEQQQWALLVLHAPKKFCLMGGGGGKECQSILARDRTLDLRVA